MKYYVIGEDKSLKEASADVLPLAGGNMKGNIGYQGSKATTDMIRFIDNPDNNYGNGLALGGLGVVVLAAGESIDFLSNIVSVNTERVIIGADGLIDFYVNCQDGLEAAVKVTLNANGLLSGHQKAITSGTAAPSGGANGDIYIQY